MGVGCSCAQVGSRQLHDRGSRAGGQQLHERGGRGGRAGGQGGRGGRAGGQQLHERGGRGGRAGGQGGRGGRAGGQQLEVAQVQAAESQDTHFISLPLALHPALVLQVTKFHDSVMDEARSSSSLPEKDEGHGLEESILIRPATLHLTILMLKLWNKERVAAAVEVLQGLKSKLLEALDHRRVAVRLKGVECMKGSPAKAHVLYAKVEDTDEENRLLGACKVIRDGFLEAGLVSEKEKKQELKLHATLINSSHRKRKRGKRFGERIPFDARAIISKHGLEEWGEYTITEAHLSERFAFDEDGYYHCCGFLKFPAS